MPRSDSNRNLYLCPSPSPNSDSNYNPHPNPSFNPHTDPSLSLTSKLTTTLTQTLQVTTFSGWSRDLDRLGEFAATHRQARGGDGDGAEAAKTAAVRLLKEATKPCVVIW